MVAASKLRRAQDAINGARNYSDKLEDISTELLGGLLKSHASSEEKAAAYLTTLHPLLSENTKLLESEEVEARTVVLLVVASDRGLCGAYNTNVLKAARKHYEELTAREGWKVQVYTIGRKASDYFRTRNIEHQNFPDFWSGRFSVHTADKLTQKLSDEFTNGRIHEVQVVYTQFESALSQTVRSKKALPIALDVNELLNAGTETDANQGAAAGEAKAKLPYAVDPSPIELFGSLLPVQLRMQIFAMLADSLASEYGSRMTSMDNATRNAGEMISSLTLQANRLRQAAITTELMEIIGGAEALKG